MYAHPAFLRGRPELLMQLQKCKNAADRKRNMKVSLTQKTNSLSTSSERKAPSFETTTPLLQEQEIHNGLTRTVSPCSSQGELSPRSDLRDFDSRNMSNAEPASRPQIYSRKTCFGMSSPSVKGAMNITAPFVIPDKYNEVRVGGSIGKIGLLALAMRCVVEGDMP